MNSFLGTSLLLRVAFTLLLTTRLTWGNWTLFVQADCWQGTGNLASGASCDASGDCDPQFAFCLRPFGTAGTDAEDCPLGRVETGEFDSGDAFCFGSTYIDEPANVPNPIPFSNESPYPGMFQLFVNVMDLDLSFHDLIADIFINLQLNPSDSFTSLGTYGTGSGGSITLQFKVTCHTNYYGPNCTTFCIDTDNNTGHFTCGSNGEKLCLTGWSEPSGNCLTPVCNGCHPFGGSCTAPDECTCLQGWSGDQCNQCQPKMGCVNGICTSPGECICSTNWGGPLCDIDLIPCETQSPCLNGGTCANNGAGGYTCACSSNYVGINCETPVNTCDPNPCLNDGVCTLQDGAVICSSCQNGCSGSLCDDCGSSICDSSPCENGGSCQDTSSGFECQCPDGYLGGLCDITPCSLDPCVNGSTCVNLNGEPLCACSTGQGDVCTKVCNPNPCLNGGECSLTWDGSFSFLCTCSSGFTGSVCHLMSTTDPTNSMSTPSEDSVSFTSSSADASSSDSDTLVAAIVGSSVLVVIVVIMVLVVVVACIFVRSKKQRPPITIDFRDLAQPSVNDQDMNSLNGQSVEVEKTDLSPPNYNDL